MQLLWQPRKARATRCGGYGSLSLNLTALLPCLFGNSSSFFFSSDLSGGQWASTQLTGNYPLWFLLTWCAQGAPHGLPSRWCGASVPIKGKLTDQPLPDENQSTVFFMEMVQDAINSVFKLESILLSTLLRLNLLTFLFLCTSSSHLIRHTSSAHLIISIPRH